VARSEDARAAHVKLLRTIRLDPSDTFVFERAAEPGEWAVPGAFAFWNTDAAKLEGKARSAFRGAFLGVESLGWSTLVQIVEASAADRAALVERLAQQLVAHFGAPDSAAARAAAEEEVAFAESLCNHPADTLIAVHRNFEDGEMREAFRTLHPRGEKKPMRAFSFLEVEGEEDVAEEVDLVALAEAGKSHAQER
jgi:phenylpyruvate tautomerase PptA (4-oxalocrotonate tautomerase family)